MILRLQGCGRVYASLITVLANRVLQMIINIENDFIVNGLQCIMLIIRRHYYRSLLVKQRLL
jgi:hypothetical protein